MERIFEFYVHIAPPWLRRLLSPIVSCSETLRQAICYTAVGLVAAIVDLGTLRILLLLHAFLSAAVTGGYAASTCVHFTLNKYLSFRSFGRNIPQQAATYIAVILVVWAATLLSVEVLVRLLHMNAIIAKLISIPVVVPVSFLGHRHLTFGYGIEKMLKRLENARTPQKAAEDA